MPPIRRSSSWRKGGGAGRTTGKDRPWQPLGLLRVKVCRGDGLAVKDLWKNSSDPYLIVRMGTEKLKTHVVKKNLNPEWNEVLTLSVTEPIHPIKVEVYDRDTFSFDDPMGTAEISIEPLVEAFRMGLDSRPEGTVITKITPSRQNCFAEVSTIYWSNNTVVQDVVLRLRDVESGELEMQLQWASIDKARVA